MAFTNAGGKFYIATTTSGSPAVTTPTPQPTALDKTAFEAITEWTEVKNVGSLPESGNDVNIVKYDTVDTDVTQKGHGVTDAGNGTLEVAYDATDAGQIALRAAAATKFQYAFKRELTDAPDGDHTNTVLYNRGIITGPKHSGGRNEDFVLETYSFGFNQKEIVVPPAEIGG